MAAAAAIVMSRTSGVFEHHFISVGRRNHARSYRPGSSVALSDSTSPSPFGAPICLKRLEPESNLNRDPVNALIVTAIPAADERWKETGKRNEGIVLNPTWNVITWLEPAIDNAQN